MSGLNVANLSGAMDGAVITIKHGRPGSREITFMVEHFMLDDAKPMERSLRFTDQGITIMNHGFVIKPQFQRKGIGVRSFAIEAKAAIEIGASRITAVAEGGPHDAVFTGWKVWPKIGYDADLTHIERQAVQHVTGKATTVLDLMQSAEGVAWWEANGNGRIMSFDLTEDSRSMRMLRQYMARKGVRI